MITATQVASTSNAPIHIPYISSTVYRIYCAGDERSYYGFTDNDYRVRMSGHRFELKNRCHGNPDLQAAYDRYGMQSFTFTALHTGLTHDEADELETAYIEANCNCYNKDKNPLVKRDNNPIVNRLTSQQVLTIMKLSGKKYTQRQIAQQVKCTPPQVSRILRGECNYANQYIRKANLNAGSNTTH